MGRHRLDEHVDGRPDHGADEQWADDLAAMRSDQAEPDRSTTFPTSTEAAEVPPC